MPIETSEWKINKHPLDYDPELISWIKKINIDFRKRGKYKPFELYCKQAQEWADDPFTLADCKDYDEQVWWLKRNHIRCKENTLFYANQYGVLKDGSGEGGITKFESWEGQKIVLHLLDRGYSTMIGKGRQFGFTSVMGIFANKKINFNKNLFIKFVTHNADKGVEIFLDKIKWPFGQIPDAIRHHVVNDRDNLLKLGEKEEKGKTRGMGSSVKVDTPAVDAINGGSPDIVMIDEIGLFDIFGTMMREGRPTMFRYDPVLKKQTMVRQLIAWGTGGQMGMGATAFEEEFMAAIHSFNEGNLSYGIIPIFFNAFAREGLTQEMFDAEKAKYYSVQGREGEIARVQFHQHYPMSIEDMFLRTASTLVPVGEINKKMQVIYNMDPKPKHGYFEPIMNNQDQIIGCKFVPVGDDSNMIAPVTIIEEPEDGYDHRYYQGTDPISSESGHSKMGSAIIDAQKMSVSAFVNFRDKDLKYVFGQVLMLGLYYRGGTNPCAMELTEANIGDFYFNFKKDNGYETSFTPQRALPAFLQINTQKWWGISNKVQTKGKIITKLSELIDGYGDNIMCLPFWVQLKTFVEKSLVPKNGTQTQNTGRLTSYQAADLRRDYDDMIFGIVYAYINVLAYQRFEPVSVGSSIQGSGKTMVKYMQNAQTGWARRRCLVDSKGKILKMGVT
jgi:hypothetical protein